MVSCHHSTNINAVHCTHEVSSKFWGIQKVFEKAETDKNMGKQTQNLRKPETNQQN